MLPLIPIAAIAALAILAPISAAEAGGRHCRDYTRTLYFGDGFLREERGTACLNRWGEWEYFANNSYYPYGNTRVVQYYESPTRYYQQPNTVFAFNFGKSKDNHRHDWNRDHNHRHDHDRGKGRGHDRDHRH